MPIKLRRKKVATGIIREEKDRRGGGRDNFHPFSGGREISSIKHVLLRVEVGKNPHHSSRQLRVS